MKYLKYPLAIFVGFISIFLGSIEIPSLVLNTLYGPYPSDGIVPFNRIFLDFWISFLFTILGGYLTARISPSKPIVMAAIPGFMYFTLSAYWYSVYGPLGSGRIWAILMLLKVLVGALLGGYRYKKYNNSNNFPSD